MNPLIKEKIILDENISELILSTRKKKNISLKEISQELKINIEYLKAIENNNLDKLPAGIYTKNFIKSYASFLGLDIDKIKKDTEENINDKKKYIKKIFSKKVPGRKYFLCIPKIIKNIIIILIVLSFLIYLGFFINNIISAPKLLILYPKKDINLNQNSIEISGITENEVEIYINEELVLIDNQGKFLKTVNLKKGINLISISAQKKYSKKNIIIRKILVN